MLEKPEIVRVERRDTAVVHITTPRERIEEAIDPAIREVVEALAAQGVPPAGPLVSSHLRLDPKIFDFKVGFPVERPFVAAGRVRPGELPAATVAKAVYRGPYDGLTDAWSEFGSWMQATGLRPAAVGLWEAYVRGPESSSDPNEWCTELYRVIEI
jgi:effector-binding domain-containing protein